MHGTNEYPFIIDRDGITVVPITSAGLAHPASEERVSTGIPTFDDMLGGAGFFRGSTILITGTAGTGKTSLAARFVEAACERGERGLYFAFEESQDQLIRNMSSLGMDLGRCVKTNLLAFSCSRPTLLGLESHLAGMMRQIESFAPDVIVVDPISSLLTGSVGPDVQAMLIRLIDYLKTQQITALLTSLAEGAPGTADATEIGISSIVDTWIVLRDVERAQERGRSMHIRKSRGMKHSREIRELQLSDRGISMLDPVRGRAATPAGAARAAPQAQHARRKPGR
jgi:circadian clock protein KaiC